LTSDELEFSGAGPSLKELIALYGSDDDLGKAITNAELETYRMMRQYPGGVPSGVMFASATKSIEWIADLLASIIVEVAGELRDWTADEVKEQEGLTGAVIALLRAHATNVTLKAYAPESEGGNNDRRKKQ